MEVCGEDVSKTDNENITVLHWAAINNRIAVASYLIQVYTKSIIVIHCVWYIHVMSLVYSSLYA